MTRAIKLGSSKFKVFIVAKYLLKIYKQTYLIKDYFKIYRARKQINTITIGDSHARYLHGCEKFHTVQLVNQKQLVIWIGAKTLYTIGVNGFKFSYRIIFLLKLVGGRKPIIILLGEIDCRNHLPKEFLTKSSLEFDNLVTNYKKSCIELINRFNFSNAVIITPNPPSSRIIGGEYPTVGSLFERVSVTKLLAESLSRISSEQFIVINIFDLLSDENSTLNPVYTNDELHVNKLGAGIIINEINQKLKGVLLINPPKKGDKIEILHFN